MSEVKQEGRPKVVPRRSFAAAASLVSLATLLSRILGLVREMVFAHLLGAGLHADAFNTAFRIPNLLRDLFAEGALSSAFVPTYSRILEREGREAAHRLARRLFTLLAVLLGGLVIMGIVGAEWIVALLSPGFKLQEGKAEIATLLTQIMMPFLLLVSFAAVAMGMLNAEGRFGLPALSPAMFNLVAIMVGIALWASGLPMTWVLVGWSVGTLVGGFAQLAIQWPGLRSRGFRMSLDWAPADSGLKEIGRLMTPAVIGLAAVQVNIIVNSHFASYEQGGQSALTYAFRILYLPIGIFGVALGTIAASGFARQAAVGDMDGVRSTLRESTSMLVFLTLPATVGLMILREPIVRLIYERGRFDAAGTQMAAAALGFYAVGLVAYTSVKVLAPAFYALGSTSVPLLASVSAVATNLLINLALHRSFGIRAVALGTALGSVANAIVLATSLERRFPGAFVNRRLLTTVGRVLVATLVMGLVAYGAERGFDQWLGHEGWRARLMVGLGPVMLGSTVFFLLSSLLRIEQMGEVTLAIRRRWMVSKT
jgi:putative peptidoglycan lipid II flippase